MAKQIVVHSFADLALVFQLDQMSSPEDDTVPTERPASSEVLDETPDLAGLISRLAEAGRALAEMAQRDEAAREQALQHLERYDALVASQREAEDALQQAQRLQQDAIQLVESAFTSEARDAASQVAEQARQVEEVATRLAAARRGEVQLFASTVDLERLLAERRRQEEAQRAQAEEAERAALIVDVIASADAALNAGNWEMARDALGKIAHESSDLPQLKELRQRIAQREFAARVTRADDALWAARREFRRDPAAALARLESLDVAGLPSPLARQVFGTWARACARLCQERQMADPLRYAPDPGRGVVIARQTTTDSYVVVSALGMGDGWHVGAAVSQRIVERARPLR
ncbi:MAG: hypothetical protein U0822_11450 [Anaerolineae bacterium]